MGCMALEAMSVEAMRNERRRRRGEIAHILPEFLCSGQVYAFHLAPGGHPNLDPLGRGCRRGRP